MTSQQSLPNKPMQVTLASFWRRLAAWVYDLLGGLAVFILALLFGYLMLYLVSLPWAESNLAVTEPLNPSSLSNSLSNNPLWLIYLAASIQFYYVWSWVKAGQTAGMRAWRLKLCKPDGNLLSWKEAYLRSFLSLGGIAQIWSFFDTEKRGWHDLVCDSRVVLLSGK